MAWKMWPNVVEAHCLSPGTTWLSVAFFFGETNILLNLWFVLINDTLFTVRSLTLKFTITASFLV